MASLLLEDSDSPTGGRAFATPYALGAFLKRGGSDPLQAPLGGGSKHVAVIIGTCIHTRMDDPNSMFASLVLATLDTTRFLAWID